MRSNRDSKFKTAKNLLGQEGSTLEISFEWFISLTIPVHALSALYSVSYFLVNGDTVGLSLHL